MARMRVLTGAGLLGIALATSSCETAGLSRLAGNVLSQGQAGELNIETIVAGLKEALQVGTGNAVSQTSRKGGFADNPKLRIQSPEQIRKVTDAMRNLGLGEQVDQFEAKMNQAAEQAVGEATAVFVGALKELTIADAKAILNGPDDAATQYFRAKTGDDLRKRFAPIVEKQMAQVGAVDAYNRLITRYEAIPFMPKASFGPEDHVTEKSLDGLFMVLADEERKIRENPAARTTELLRRVFGR